MLSVQFTVLVVEKMCHQLSVLLYGRASATVAIIELRGNPTMVRSSVNCKHDEFVSELQNGYTDGVQKRARFPTSRTEKKAA